MSRYDDFVSRVEAEAEGPEAIAQLQAFRDYYRLGRQLAERRRELHWTQTHLAELTGIRQSEISRIERAVGNPTLMTLSRLTSALRMDFRCEMREERRAQSSVTQEE
jgi:transcriptional regulator with XRE-family HTH domain